MKYSCTRKQTFSETNAQITHISPHQRLYIKMDVASPLPPTIQKLVVLIHALEPIVIQSQAVFKASNI